MCRMAAYLGPEITLEDFLLNPPHSLRAQARTPHELRYAQFNADGFGFGWFNTEGQPGTYVNPASIWADPNLPSLAHSLYGDLWLGFIRAATNGSHISHANTQPFCDSEILFVHNGFLLDFANRCRPAISAELTPEIAAAIQGNTDSEYLFALLRQILSDDPDMAMETALAEVCARVDDWNDDSIGLLNFLVSEGTRLYAVRHAVNDLCPSLYYCTDNELFPGAQLVGSEPLDSSGIWQPVPEHHILILDPEEPPELVEL